MDTTAASVLFHPNPFSAPRRRSLAVTKQSGFGFRPRSRAVVAVSVAGGEVAPPSVTPVYMPTPPNRELRTPHSGHELMLGNTFIPEKDSSPPNYEVPPQEFSKRVMEGFQVSPIWHQGFIRDDGRSRHVQTVETARWQYSTRPVYGWGDVKSRQKSTAGWLAAFPVFEPHWQICMAAGLSTGWIEWDGELFEFENAPSYSEKNWGGGFPRKWFWVQCNVFDGVSGEVSLTTAGGLRKLPGLNDVYESPALIGVHYEGSFYEFVPWTGTVRWEISPWGFWHLSGENDTHMVELEATTKEPGTPLRAPTVEGGLVTACRDTCLADLKLQMWEKRYDGSKGKAPWSLSRQCQLVHGYYCSL